MNRLVCRKRECASIDTILSYTRSMFDWRDRGVTLARSLVGVITRVVGSLVGMPMFVLCVIGAFVFVVWL